MVCCPWFLFLPSDDVAILSTQPCEQAFAGHPYVPRAERQHQILLPRIFENRFHGALDGARVLDAAVAEVAHFFRQQLSTDAFDRLFRGGVNIQHVDRVGLVEAAREFIEQRLCARIPMRLEHGMDAAEMAHPRRGQRGSDFGGAMAVVVDYRYSARLAAYLE